MGDILLRKPDVRVKRITGMGAEKCKKKFLRKTFKKSRSVNSILSGLGIKMELIKDTMNKADWNKVHNYCRQDRGWKKFEEILRQKYYLYGDLSLGTLAHTFGTRIIVFSKDGYVVEDTGNHKGNKFTIFVECEDGTLKMVDLKKDRSFFTC